MHARPALDRCLTLSADEPTQPGGVEAATAAWSALLGGAPVLLVRSVEWARALLIAAGAGEGATVVVPANATQAVVDAIKSAGARPRFAPVDDEFAAMSTSPPETRWRQPSAAALLSATEASREAGGFADRPPTIVDLAETLLAPTGDWQAPCGADAALFGLHLSADARSDGALIAFAPTNRGRELHARVVGRLRARAAVEPERALAQAKRLVGLAAPQWEALAATWDGLHEAAGLPLPARDAVIAGPALAAGVPVRVPATCEAATFYAYVVREATPIRWLPVERPLHPRAIRELDAAAVAATSARLARWLLVPVGPESTAPEVTHGVLGVVKAAEYLGARWTTNPERAAWYTALLDEWYGPGRDGFAPACRAGPAA